VILLEREKFPRFKIGESLLPHSMGAFQRLGILERLREGPFMEKFGADILSADGSRSIRVLFKSAIYARYDRSFHVTRADFDKLLLDRAAEVGVEVREETCVESVTFTPDFGSVRVRPTGGGNGEEIQARFVGDCSGRNTVLGPRVARKTACPELQKFSVFAHYEKVAREEGVGASLIRIVRGEDSWFWLIPLTPERTSVGVVMDLAHFKAGGYSGPEECMDALIRNHPAVADRLRDSRRVTPVRSAGHYSYRVSPLVGPRWLLAGDAAGFIDPIFSTGVFLALLSGEEGARTVHEVLDADKRLAAKRLRAYERKVNRVMDFYLRFVKRWYQPHSIEVFLNPVEHFKIASAVNAVLSGKTNNPFSIRWRLWVFYTVIWIHRWIPLVPRSGLSSPPKERGTA